MRILVLLVFVIVFLTINSQRIGFEIEVPGGNVRIPEENNAHVKFTKGQRFDGGVNDEDWIRMTVDDAVGRTDFNLEIISAYSAFPVLDDGRVCTSLDLARQAFDNVETTCVNLNQPYNFGGTYTAPVTKHKTNFGVFPQVTLSMEIDDMYEMVFKAVPKLYSYNKNPHKLVVNDGAVGMYKSLTDAAKAVLLPDGVTAAPHGIQLFAFFVMQNMALSALYNGNHDNFGKGISGFILLRTSYKQLFNYANTNGNGHYFTSAAQLEKSIMTAYKANGNRVESKKTLVGSKDVMWHRLSIGGIKFASEYTVSDFFGAFFDTNAEDPFRRIKHQEFHFFESMGQWNMHGKLIAAEFRLFFEESAHNTLLWRKEITYLYASALALKNGNALPIADDLDNVWANTCNGKVNVHLAPLVTPVLPAPDAQARNRVKKVL